MIAHDAKMVGDCTGSRAGGDSDRPEPLAQPVDADQGVGGIGSAYPLAGRIGLIFPRSEMRQGAVESSGFFWLPVPTSQEHPILG